MKICRLRLLGFKSFVDPVELMILPGITGVVGPNGCGKSNLLEALRWVMGENRPTSIRGGGMEDVIFAGAGTRPAKNYAEVMLELEGVEPNSIFSFNKDGLVDVVRRVTRDIGSSFRLNGKDVRAKDVAMLFADSSTGAHSPSLVRQGQISELINSNPKSRRRLLEEAAGISGLHQRRHEAELKLKSSTTNLSRIHEVHEQLQSQSRGLEKQAKQAIKYRELGENIRDTEGLLLCKKWTEVDEKSLFEENARVSIMKDSKIVEKDILLLTSKRNNIEENISKHRVEEAKFSAAFQRLRVERETAERAKEQATENIKVIQARYEETVKDQERQEAQKGDAIGVIERLDWELNELTKLTETHDEIVSNKRRVAAGAAEKLHKDESEWSSQSKTFAELSARYSSSQVQVDEATANSKKILEEIKVLESDILTFELEQKETKKNLRSLEKELKSCDEHVQKADKELSQAEHGFNAAKLVEADKRTKLSSTEGHLAAHNSELEAIKKTIDADGKDLEGILNEVTIKPGFENALGAAFLDELRSPVITNNEMSGWYELFNGISAPALPAGSKPFKDIVSAPRPLETSLAFIGLVNASDGHKLQKSLKPGQKLVAANGDLWRWDGFCCVGSEQMSQAAFRLKQKNRVKELQKEIIKANERKQKAERELSAAITNSVAAEKKYSYARNKLKNNDREFSEKLLELSKVEAQLRRIISRIESFKEKIKRRVEDEIEVKKDLRENKKILSELGCIEKSKDKLEKKRLVVDESRKFMAEKRAAYDQIKSEVKSRQKRLIDLEKEKYNWRNRLSRISESILDLDNRKELIVRELKQASKRPGSLSDDMQKLSENLSKAEQRKIESSEALSRQESLLRNLVDEQRVVEKKATELREEILRANINKENIEGKKKEIEKTIFEKVGKTPQMFIELQSQDFSTSPSVDVLEDQLLKFRNKREALGAVNLRAEQDLEELSRHIEEIAREKEDLESAISKLRSGIVSLNSEGRSRLLDAYNQVNSNFSELFQALFGGGVARLDLVESDDPLDVGLEIMCQPPGKKLSTISLLSGGEQTLTALALIFAVFKANPSPICVLDEVDAPLDDANVERFCGLLDEMKAHTNTRFLIITHHPLTMSRMDRLYGVTMVERGVSQLVSVDLKKAEELLEE